jgi:hypothetical protein
LIEMAGLRLFLLGPPRLERDGAVIDIGRRKATALLIYLAATRQSYSRDALADGSFAAQNGLAIRAANGRDLWNLNRSAPRLLRPVSGDFTIQTICGPLLNAIDPLPNIGGLLIWRDDNNFLRLVWGNRGPDHISFEGCRDAQDIILGQGRLPHPNPTDGTPLTRVVLRLERQDNQVAALCSAGAAWFRVGQAVFPAGPVEAGLHAIGWIDRTIYPGAYPEGAGMRFERFELWG